MAHSIYLKMKHVSDTHEQVCYPNILNQGRFGLDSTSKKFFLKLSRNVSRKQI